MLCVILEHCSKDKFIPYCSCINTLSKNSGMFNRDITEKEYQEYLKDCVVF